MVMIVAFPWPAPSANAEPAGLNTAMAVTEAMAEPRTVRPAQVEELICWTRRERLHLCWYRLRLTASEIYRPAGRPANRG